MLVVAMISSLVMLVVARSATGAAVGEMGVMPDLCSPVEGLWSWSVRSNSKCISLLSTEWTQRVVKCEAVKHSTERQSLISFAGLITNDS